MQNEVANENRRLIVRSWLPLWISWLAMALEFPLISAFVSRLPAPDIHLAAFGGIVVPVAFLIEAPIIMLLSSSNKLSKNYASYRKLYSIMMWMGLVLTALHALITFTPLYYVVVRQIIGAPEPIIEPARVGMAIFLIWTWSIAYRRFHQGILIRFHHAKYVGIGTVLRLSTNALVGVIAITLVDIPGIVAATSGAMLGVFFEALFIGIVTQKVIRAHLAITPAAESVITTGEFFRFYTPLAITTILDFLVNPISSSAISRMPLAIESLAVLPVVQGLSFALRSPGFAFTEIVIALFNRENALQDIRKFARYVMFGSVLVAAIILGTPIKYLLFEQLIGLAPALATLSVHALWFVVPSIAIAPNRNIYQGIIVHSGKTKAMTIGTIIFLVTISSVLYLGIYFQVENGITISMLGVSCAAITQLLWLRFASRPHPSITLESN